MNHVKAGVTIGAALVVAAAAFYAQQLSKPAAKPRPAAIAREAPAYRPDTVPATIELIKQANTDERLKVLEAKLAEPRTPQLAPEASPEMSPSGAEVEEQHAARIAQHSRDQVDRVWAERTANALKEDFARDVGGATYSVKSIDCRSTSCNVTFSWPSRGEALGGWKAVLSKGIRVPCGKQIVVPESAGADGGSAEASMLFDCSEWDGEFLF